jgi:hypothetical protein
MEELNTLVEAVQEKLNSSTAQPKVIEVVVKQTVNTNNLDKIAEKLSTVAKAENANTLMIISGKEGSIRDGRLLSLAQADSLSL